MSLTGSMGWAKRNPPALPSGAPLPHAAPSE